jgi:hypothetical protein
MLQLSPQDPVPPPARMRATQYIGRDLIGKLVDRFHLTTKVSDMTLGTTVVPVTHVDSFRLFVQEDIPVFPVTATGDVTLMTCPINKRRTVYGAYFGLSTGTWTASQWKCGSPKFNILPVKTFSAGGVGYYYPADMPSYMEPGWVWGLYINTFTGAGIGNCSLMYSDEDIT